MSLFMVRLDATLCSKLDVSHVTGKKIKLDMLTVIDFLLKIFPIKKMNLFNVPNVPF